MHNSKKSRDEMERRIKQLEQEVLRLKEVEKKLNLNQKNLKEAEILAKLGHWELDLVTNTLKWSDEIYRIFNLEPQEFGATYEAFLSNIHPEDINFVNKSYTDSLKNKTQYNIIHRLSLKDGTVKYVNEKCHTDYAPDGTPLRSFGTILDMTERYRMDEELQKVKNLESIGLLAGGIAHDFNNLLAGIMGTADLALNLLGSASKPIADLFNQIVKASYRAQALAQQLLTFSKGGEPIKKEVNIAEIIKVAALFVLSGSNVKPIFDLPDDLETIEADSGQLGQVIQNLVLNARQAMPKGGVVKLSCQNYRKTSKDSLPLPDGNYLNITIQDSGEGIPEKYLEKVFAPYFTVKESGSGLGLSISHSIVTKHGGHISIWSKLGQGSRIEIYLPSTGKPSVLFEPDDEPASIKGAGRILIVDDEQLIRNTSKRMLATLGYEVACARNGAEAISLYLESLKSQNPFDLVIMDLTIPGGLGGREATIELLKINPKARIIVSSGYSNDPVTANFWDYGFKAAIPKPYQLRDLSRVVNDVMKKK